MKITIAFMLSIICFANLSAQMDTCLINSEIGISFPPVADLMQRNFAKPHLDSLGIKKMRFGENWSFREPSQGEFNWGPLDSRLSWVTQNGYEVLLTVQSNGPDWACGLQNQQSCVFNDNNDFKTYIDALLLRYPNQIDKIQFGNEWQSKFWYIGNAQEFIEANNILYQSVQEHSPSTKVVLGGFTAISLRFLAGCNGFVDSFYDDEGTLYDRAFLDSNCTATDIVEVMQRIDSVLLYANYDILDMHLYDDSEQWDEYYANFSDTISKPIIVSEFGGPNMNIEPYTETYQAERVYEYVKKLDSIGISEIYFFKLVEGTANPAHSTSGLIEDTTLVAKPAYSVIKAFNACVPSNINPTSINQLKLYPNPAKDWVAIELDKSNNGCIEIKVFSKNGQLVFMDNRMTENQLKLNISDFETGIYFVQVKSNNKIIGWNTLLVEK